MSTTPAAQPAAATASEPSPSTLIRIGVALIAGNLCWIAPFVAGVSVLVPAKLEIITPAEKVEAVASLSVIGSVVALAANILFGALSDRTRSRLGRRLPWLLVGSVGTSVCFMILPHMDSARGVILVWCVFQGFLNAIVAPLVAIIPDRVPERMRGTFSAIYGVGTTVGSGIASIIASRFITNPDSGFLLFAVVLLLAGPLVGLIAPDESNRDAPRAAFDRETLLRNFSFPTHNCRDFYLAVIGKLLFVLAMFCITGYQLYIFTDHFMVSADTAGSLIALMATIQMVGSLVVTLVSGPLSDRIGRRKPLVVLASLIMAAALACLVVWHDPRAMLLFAVLASGIAFGIYTAVDQALNYEVLPDPESAAKDLGIINMANTGGQIIAPVVMSFAVTSLGGYTPGFVVAAGAALASAVLIGLIRSAR